MLKYSLLHPQITKIVGSAGHHARVLIADGNYPSSTKKGPRAKVVYLNLAPGIVTCAQVLEALLSASPFETVNTMMFESSDPYSKHMDGDPLVWEQYRRVILEAGADLTLEPIKKWDFYEAVSTEDHVLTIQTGDTALYANILLTVGARVPS